ncbi:ATP-binding protein [Saccharibacillus sp. CPCC 101409]|uniref:hybrid sensor histidine kinase/response regulator n=1 Tax=Saccharibacillus sp. CPCC 101409 TaxID=3058041 RepID=UPI002672E846|nr:ATP-binding protein [Saccharibacillus sp. CPCC 101409]MDO3408187.1 ATP-binding protein [Saccharibacillus sp. CPCC 101409]
MRTSISKRRPALTTKTSVALLLFFLLLFLAGLRLVLTNPYGMHNQPQARQGVIDLREAALDERHTLTLDGEWEFYPERFIASDPAGDSAAAPALLNVPGNWGGVTAPDGSKTNGYGTYRLRILLGDRGGASYKLMIKDIQTSFRLYMNGQVEEGLGRTSKTAAGHEAEVNAALFTLPQAAEIDLMIEVSNFENPLRGGIARSIKFGESHAVNSERTYNVGMQLITLAVLLLHAVYIGIIYLFSRKNRLFLWFTLLLIAALFGLSLDEDKILLAAIPLDFVEAKKTVLVAFNAMTALMLKLTVSFCVERTRQKFYRLYFVPAALYSAFIILAPIQWVLITVNMGLFSLMTLIAPIVVPFLLIRYVIEKDRDAVFLLVAAGSLASNLVWGGFKNTGIADSGFYAFDILIAFLSTVVFGIGRYFRNNEALVELTDRLQRANKTKDDFLANTSHELRTPLHGMINIADGVLRGEGNALTERSRKDLLLLTQVGRRMALLLGDLLDVSQLRENRLILRREPVKVQSTAAGVLDMLRYTSAGKALTLEQNIPADFPAVQADEKRLTQILFNLVHNAIKFTTSGRVAVDARLIGGRAEIRVSDTGAGIGSEERARIFAPYEQGDPLLAAAGGGIGLGLSISRSLAELHGGELGVESVPGEGSVFFFSLPLAESSAAEEALPDFGGEPPGEAGGIGHTVIQDSRPGGPNAASAQPDVPRGELPNILAVDDDPVNLRVLRGILPQDRYRMTAVLSGAEALEKLGGGPWDLVIADVMMPQMSGYELAARIRERYSRAELPILLLTARGRPEDIYSGFAAGASDYIVKPVDSLELTHRVKALTDLKRAVGERLNLEAAYLQAQIQPHFLFNALNSITALSGIDLDRMNETIEAFGSYLKISFDYWNAQPLVPLERELELVQSYLYIEQMRFEDRLSIEVSIDESVDPGMTLPPLCIQPLVENAVRHGVLSRSGGGRVSLSIEAEEESVAFRVEDDGVGMDERTLRGLLAPGHVEGRGIGIRNTDHRLKRLYGSGLSVASKPGEGTSVAFRIPRS